MTRIQIPALVVFLWIVAPQCATADDAPAVRALAFSPDGKIMVAGAGGRDQPGGVTAYSVATRKRLWHHAEPAGVSSLTVAPDGESIAIARGSPTVLRLDIATGKSLGELGPHPKDVRAVAFTLDGMLATGSDGTIRLWDVAAGTVKVELTGHAVEVRSIVASPNGKWLVSTGPDTTRIWDVATETELKGLIRQERAIAYYGIAFAGPDRLLLADNSGTQRVIQLPAGPELLRFKSQAGYEGMACSPSAGLLAIRGFGGPTVAISDLTFRAPTPEEQGRIDKLLKDFDDDAIAVREAATTALRQIGSVAEPALRQAMTDGPSPEVRMRARETRKAILEEPVRRLTGITGGVGPMAFSPDGTLFVTGADDGTIRAWDPRTGRQTSGFETLAAKGPN
jgi:WD40 repeat protein